MAHKVIQRISVLIAFIATVDIFVQAQTPDQVFKNSDNQASNIIYQAAVDANNLLNLAINSLLNVAFDNYARLNRFIEEIQTCAEYQGIIINQDVLKRTKNCIDNKIDLTNNYATDLKELIDSRKESFNKWPLYYEKITLNKRSSNLIFQSYLTNSKLLINRAKQIENFMVEDGNTMTNLVRLLETRVSNCFQVKKAGIIAFLKNETLNVNNCVVTN